MVLVEYQARNVLSGHLRQLSLEKVLEADEEDGSDGCGFSRGHDGKDYFAIKLFDRCWSEG